MHTSEILSIRSHHPRSEKKPRVPGDVVCEAIESVVDGDRRARPLLVYIHIPFCSSKCSFCTWVSGVSVSQLRSSDDIRSRYAEAVKEQIEFYAPRLTALGYVPDIVYWGGGTPSILSSSQINTIADAVRDNFDLSAIREYTVESSPETLTEEKIRAFQAAGMNRLSIGVQSFNEGELRRAGRAHSPAQAEEAFRRAERLGCVNRNMDIITGFPNQTREVLEQTIAKTLELRPEHITAYTYHAALGTVMARQIARGDVAALGAEDRASAQEFTHDALTANGYSKDMAMYYSRGERYRFKGESYYFNWEGDHIGFGSGAFSALATHRTINARGNLDEYMSSPTSFDSFEKSGERIAVDESLSLLFLNGNTIIYDRFFNRFGFDFRELLEVPRMKAYRIALENNGTPLLLGPTEAYLQAPPDGDWNGDELVRLQEKILAEIASAARKASDARKTAVAGRS